MNDIDMIFVTGKRIYLRQMMPKDLNDIHEAMSDWHDFPISLDRVIIFMKGLCYRQREVVRPYAVDCHHFTESFAICLNSDHTCIGFTEVEVKGLNVVVKKTILRPSFRGNGYHSDYLVLRHRIFFDLFGANDITVKLRGDETSSPSTYHQSKANGGIYELSGVFSDAIVGVSQTAVASKVDWEVWKSKTSNRSKMLDRCEYTGHLFVNYLKGVIS